MAEGKDPIDRDFIRELAHLVRDAELSEIRIEHEGMRLRISRGTTPEPMAYYAPAAPQQSPAQAPSGPPSGAPADASPEAATRGAPVPSPMVGTVYRAPEPGANAFVEVGDEVREGQTVMIVEAMKHMNEVAAPQSGRVVSVLVEDGQPVEYGQPLLTIE